MGIDETNYRNRMHMISETRTDLDFRWEDKEIISILMKQFNEVHPSSDDPKEFIKDKNCLNTINNNIRKMNKREIKEDIFIANIEKEFKIIIEKYDTLKYQNKYNINYYKKNLLMANRLLIDGEGGIGKSYFLFKLEEELKNLSISHLCIYCKYTKNITKEIEEIKTFDDDFYLIIDAFNELDQDEQKCMIDMIRKISMKSNVNIIVSYRTKNLDSCIVEDLKKILKNTYTFKGVEYESSLTKIIETYGVEATKFIDVIESNNPLYLKMLYKILEDPKIKKEEIGDLVQITHIFEQYIKSICGKKYWDNTKKIGIYMFEKNKTSIEEKEIQNILNNNATKYIKKMIENNLINCYTYENTTRYVFRMQKLSDYIIARTLHDKIDELNDNEIIDIINEKLFKIYSLSEPFIILIFDRFKKNDIRRAINIIFNSKLKENFELSILRKTTFTIEQIEYIQNEFTIQNIQNVFLELGGYHNRPFNCSNYLTNRLIENNNYMQGVTVKYYESTYIIKLKNMLYSIIFIDEKNDYIEEAFWYSFWLMSASNDRIGKLALKVLFDIVDKFNDYVDILREYYDKVEDYYIKKGIIRVLTSIDVKDSNLIKFFRKILNDYLEIDAEIIYRISNFLETNIEYIKLNKYNIYNKITKDNYADYDIDFNYIISLADVYLKYLFKFDIFNNENELFLHNNFILNDKNEIMEWNKELNVKFDCVKDEGYCKYRIGGNWFKKYLKNIEIVKIDNKKLFIGLKNIFIYICNKYNYRYSKESEKYDSYLNPFENSILKKILLISQDILLGSLMCNYFTSEMSIYNYNNIFGYKVYEPINLNEEEYRIYSPVSIYCEKIDKLNNEVIKKIDLYGERNEKWYNDKKLSIENITKLTEPLLCENEQWTLICADIHRYVRDGNKHIYTEIYRYNIGIDSTRNIKEDIEPTELTISNKSYIGNIKKYREQDYKKSKKIKEIEYNSQDFKETYLNFPPTIIILEFDLYYNRKYSTWDNIYGESIVYCDNNSKNYYNDPITGVIYIKTSYLNKIMKKYQIKYWAYTEKSYLNKGWNEEATVHIELDEHGNVLHNIKNKNLISMKKEYKEECKNCKFGIYQEMNKNVCYDKLIGVDYNKDK